MSLENQCPIIPDIVKKYADYKLFKTGLLHGKIQTEKIGNIINKIDISSQLDPNIIQKAPAFIDLKESQNKLQQLCENEFVLLRATIDSLGADCLKKLDGDLKKNIYRIDEIIKDLNRRLNDELAAIKSNTQCDKLKNDMQQLNDELTAIKSNTQHDLKQLNDELTAIKSNTHHDMQQLNDELTAIKSNTNTQCDKLKTDMQQLNDELTAIKSNTQCDKLKTDMQQLNDELTAIKSNTQHDMQQLNDELAAISSTISSVYSTDLTNLVRRVTELEKSNHSPASITVNKTINLLKSDITKILERLERLESITNTIPESIASINLSLKSKINEAIAQPILNIAEILRRIEILENRNQEVSNNLDPTKLDIVDNYIAKLKNAEPILEKIFRQNLFLPKKNVLESSPSLEKIDKVPRVVKKRSGTFNKIAVIKPESGDNIVVNKPKSGVKRL